MNTLCKICGHVELQGHHKCDPEGDSVRVSVTTPGVLRMDMLEHYGRTPASPETVVKVSFKPFDSAGAPLAATTFTLGDVYYGRSVTKLNIKKLTAAEIRRAVRILKRNSVPFGRIYE